MRRSMRGLSQATRWMMLYGVDPKLDTSSSFVFKDQKEASFVFEDQTEISFVSVD